MKRGRLTQSGDGYSNRGSVHRNFTDVIVFLVIGVQLLFVFSAHTFSYQVALWKQESLQVPRDLPARL